MTTIILMKLSLLAGCGEAPPLETEAPTTVDGIHLKPRVLIEGNVSLLIPDGFSPMTEKALRLKYPNKDRPTIVYTNDKNTVDITLTHTSVNLNPTGIEKLHKQMEEKYHNQSFLVKWLKSEIVTINKHKCFLLDVQTLANKTVIRNLIVGTSLKGRLLLVSFNVTRNLEDKWIKAGQEIVQSLRVKAK